MKTEVNASELRGREIQKRLLRLEVVSKAALIKQLSPEEDTTPPLASTLLSCLPLPSFCFILLPSLPGTPFIISTICFLPPAPLSANWLFGLNQP